MEALAKRPKMSIRALPGAHRAQHSPGTLIQEPSLHESSGRQAMAIAIKSPSKQVPIWQGSLGSLYLAPSCTMSPLGSVQPERQGHTQFTHTSSKNARQRSLLVPTLQSPVATWTRPSSGLRHASTPSLQALWYVLPSLEHACLG